MVVKYENLTAVVSDKVFHCGVFIYEDTQCILHIAYNVRPDVKEVEEYLKLLYKGRHMEDKKWQF